MPSKYQLSSSSIYYEGSSVAKNLLNIKDSETIQRIEKELLEEAYDELNDRVTRMFIDMIVAYHGYQFIDYSHIEVDEYIDASIECVQFANCEKMQKIIFDGLK